MRTLFPNSKHGVVQSAILYVVLRCTLMLPYVKSIELPPVWDIKYYIQLKKQTKATHNAALPKAFKKIFCVFVLLYEIKLCIHRLLVKSFRSFLDPSTCP